MSNWKINLRNTLMSALGFGLGFVIGGLVAFLIFRNDILAPVRDLFGAGRFILGLTLIFLVIGLTVAIGGAIGGLALSYVSQSFNRAGYAWRAALAFGISYAIILLPLTFVIALISFYQVSEFSPIMLMIPLGVMGAIFGAVSSIFMGETQRSLGS